MAKRVRITYTKSAVSHLHHHRKTLRALGLRKLNSSVEHELTPAIAGMIHQVYYLVTVEEVSK